MSDVAGRSDGRRGPVCVGGVLVSVVALLAGTGSASGQVSLWDFTIDQSQSGLMATPALSVNTAGSLIGDWDADTNPTGTRTKPGIFGTFGPTENVPVPTTLGASFGGPINTSVIGGFGATINPSAGVITISDYFANVLGGGSVALPLNVTLQFDTFRTRAPDSTFIGGFPLTLPLGEATLSAMSLQQVGESLPGVLTQTGVGTFDFVVTPIVSLSATLDVLGNEFEVPGVPTPLPLVGSLVIIGETAVLTSLQMLEFEQDLDVELALPSIPFPLPTILPPGETANVLLNLMVESLAAGLVGEQNLRATGVLIPGPGSLGVLAVAGVVAVGRRRRLR